MRCQIGVARNGGPGAYSTAALEGQQQGVEEQGGEEEDPEEEEHEERHLPSPTDGDLG